MNTKKAGPLERADRSLNYIANINQNLIDRQPLRGINAYERLRGEWIAANPVHTEAELLSACVMFARACGLIIREKLLEQHLAEARGYVTE
jgi:hypothetical protein